MPFTPSPPSGSVEEVAGWTQRAGLESLERGKSLHMPGTQNLFSCNATRCLVMSLSYLAQLLDFRTSRIEILQKCVYFDLRKICCESAFKLYSS